MPNPFGNVASIKIPFCNTHKSSRLYWRDYDALPPEIKLAFQEAMTDWCVRCFLRDNPLWAIPFAIYFADQNIIAERPYG